MSLIRSLSRSSWREARHGPPVGAPRRLGVVVVAAGQLQRLGGLGQGIDDEEVGSAVDGEAHVVHAVLAGGDPPGRLLVRRDLLVSAVTAFPGDPCDVGQVRRVRRPGRVAGAQRVVGQLARLAAVGGHDEQLRFGVGLGAHERQPASVGREPRLRVVGAVGVAPGQRRAVHWDEPQLTVVLVVLQIDARDSDHHRGPVWRQGGIRGAADGGEVGDLHRSNLTHARRAAVAAWPIGRDGWRRLACGFPIGL